MRARLNKLTRTVWVICLLSFFVSCQDTIPQRSTITPGSTLEETPKCSEDQELVPETVDGETTYSCKDKEIKRPDNAIFWKSDFCACKNGKPVSYGNCSQFCSDKNTDGAERLYANFSVSEAISLGGFGNVYAWCKVSLPSDTQNPECQIEAKDESGTIKMIDVTLPVNTNSLTANIQDTLANDKTYVLTLVEKNSGSRSNSIQLIKFSETPSNTILGPLKNVPVTQYSCMVRDFSEDQATGDIYFESAYRMHFYFIPRIPPRPIPAGNSLLICHDIFNPLYGLIDQELYPRFEQLAGVFNLWDSTDPRFYDNNGNGARDINELIIQKTKNFGATIPASSSFFQEFTWASAPELENQAGNNSNSTQGLGYFMVPWIDQSTFKSYCLNSSHYNSSNAIYKALRDIIGVDTEGLYIGEKSPEAVTDSSGNVTTGYADYILVRESDLKQVWFYLKNGVPTVPTDDIVANVAVYFYYPLNKVSPFVKTSTQRVFRVRGSREIFTGTNNNSNSGTSSLNGNSSNSSGSVSTYPTHDRKIGCIPKF